MRIISYSLGIIFVLFSLVQLNDPDPVFWIAAYLIPATVSFLFTYRKPNQYLLLAFMVIYLIGCIIWFPPSFREWIHAEGEASSIGMKLPMIEEARESMGLLICSMTFLFFWLKSKTKRVNSNL